ncbi:tyrosine-type recombinase/integrase [Embleya sp. NPDC005575]|uniref:tyrosine-type recombinase/integrase n=1 Tax=Embleya sp. NPDC005575 TaxID=3156892 RepID=UPI0033AB52BF
MSASGNVVPLRWPARDAGDAVPEGMSPEEASGWTAWLVEHIDPAWRPGEWEPGIGLFTGDVDHPGTAVYRCGTAACDALTATRGLCSACRKALRAGGVGAKEFKATHIPERNRRIAGRLPCCRVGGCPREAVLWGLCLAHSSLRREDLMREPGSELEAWLARQTPYGPSAVCTVPGCRYDGRATFGLCALHARRWRQHLAQSRRYAPEDLPTPGWLERQAPFLNIHQFSLAPLHSVARLEVLYALQRRDARGQKIEPLAVRQVVVHLAAAESVAAAPAGWFARRSQANVDALVRETHRVVAGALDRFRGVDPTTRPVLDLAELGVRGVSGGPTHRPGDLDVSEIGQPWLRAILVGWITETKPTTAEVRRAGRAVLAASRALELRPGGGADMAALGFADMNAVVDTFRQLHKLDGDPMSSTARGALLSFFFKVLDYSRAAGHLDGMSASFARHSSHTVKRDDVPEDEAGKAVPESVITQLDDYTHLLGAGITHGRMTGLQVSAMARAVYELLRDTGRRPYEIAQLRVGCLEHDGGDWSLVWDNNKGRRGGRRLPVTSETVSSVGAWLAVRETVDLPSGSAPFLFPPASERGVVRHLGSDQVWAIIRSWADAVPVLLGEEFGPDGERVAFERSLIFPYAFRHSFAQRYADAGVPIDVLRDLMDHRSSDTTARYYKVTLKRKREAVDVMRLHTVDRAGRPAPMASATAYEARSVTVPFGNCTEPSNVKAGGKACPIRFQCAACPSYRPDPSFLPAIEDHVRSLKTDREYAEMMEADAFVVRNLDDQIGAFRKVGDTMRELVEAMGEDERGRVEEAAVLLRKVRAAAGGAVPLPMPGFPARREGTGA